MEMLSENRKLYSNIVAAIFTQNIKLALEMNQKINQQIVPIALKSLAVFITYFEITSNFSSCK